jgi:hypothetical protein
VFRIIYLTESGSNVKCATASRGLFKNHFVFESTQVSSYSL